PCAACNPSSAPCRWPCAWTTPPRPTSADAFDSVYQTCGSRSTVRMTTNRSRPPRPAPLVLGLHPRLDRPHHLRPLGAGAHRELPPARRRLGRGPLVYPPPRRPTPSRGRRRAQIPNQRVARYV